MNRSKVAVINWILFKAEFLNFIEVFFCKKKWAHKRQGLCAFYLFNADIGWTSPEIHRT